MKFLTISLLSLLALGVRTQRSEAQSCRGGNCGAPAAVVMPAPAEPPAHGWWQLKSGRLGLWWRGEYVGALDPLSGRWQTAGKPEMDLAGAFGLVRPAAAVPKECLCKPGECNCQKCPNDCVAQRSAINYGMDWHAQGPAPVCSISGQPVSSQVLYERLGKSGGAADIPDDASRPRLLLLSKSADVRRQFLRDVEASEWKGKCIAQAYAPDDWAITWPGSGKPLYPMDADPTLYVVEGEGKGAKIVGHVAGYAQVDLSKYLAAADKLRDQPNVDPNKTPDLKPAPPKPPAPAPGGPEPSPSPPAIAGITPNQVGYGLLAGLVGLAGVAVGRKRARDG